jgi:hypothetical protein
MFLFSLDSRTLLSTIINPNSFCASPPLVCSALFFVFFFLLQSQPSEPYKSVARSLQRDEEKKSRPTIEPTHSSGVETCDALFFLRETHPTPLKCQRVLFIFFQRGEKIVQLLFLLFT